MNQKLPDIQHFERIIFKRKNVLGLLLSFGQKCLGARQAGLMLGTDHTGKNFISPDKWDRGVMHRFDGKGVSGIFYKYLGPWFVRIKKLSPVRLYRTDPYGDRVENKGVIAYVLRKHQDYYKKGIKILIINKINRDDTEPYSLNFSIISYDGSKFDTQPDIKADQNIIKLFRPKNFVSAYIPDYGAIVFNTVDEQLLATTEAGFSNKTLLKQKLDILISAIEIASVAYLGMAKGRSAARLIWRKERRLRKATRRLKEKEAELDEQKKYLMAAGAVNAEQLDMTPVSISDGVYAFVDMAGSVTIRNSLNPRDYFLILKLCHEIAADTAAKYGCRIDNFIGDCVFIQNVSVFDDKAFGPTPGLSERVMLLTCALADFFNELHLLKQGLHAMDEKKRVSNLIKTHGVDIDFRAGMEYGPALVGPLGSSKRRIVTAIGRAVNRASRLESSGVCNKIHTTLDVVTILENALVSKDTRILWEIGKARGIVGKFNPGRYIYFFDFYRKCFKISNDIVRKNKNASYKEFSMDITYLIKCIQSPEPNRVCSGI